MEVEYRIKHLAEELNISQPAARKYYAMVEDIRSKKFKRNKNGYVIFTRQDVSIFEKIIEFKEQNEMKLEDAIRRAIAVIDGDQNYTEDTADLSFVTPMEKLEYLGTEVHRLNNLLQEQQEQAAKREETLMEFIKEQSNTMASIEEKLNYQEEQRQLESANKDEQKKSFWSILFGK
ncbi:MerR-like DNA binding protein [Sinobaca qinghaiensis]|uniref:MerR-like DNA binding protein n=1 Tax=Sinobaca qinghaiensis TaxID=342944 RepID=A0A419VU04_9BACL|nr:MerR family transcriptional regulator [Sinobaca qinghaiensis]RKD84122.1 MerR-like DNA binding protein [Sinobaca qinghaiensis]